MSLSLLLERLNKSALGLDVFFVFERLFFCQLGNFFGDTFKYTDRLFYKRGKGCCLVIFKMFVLENSWNKKTQPTR